MVSSTLHMGCDGVVGFWSCGLLMERFLGRGLGLGRGRRGKRGGLSECVGDRGICADEWDT